MNTSDPTTILAQQGTVPDPTGALNAAASGLPSPDVIARLAGEFFGAIPDASQPIDAVNLASITTAAPVDISSLTLPATGSVPGEAELQALARNFEPSQAATIPSIPAIGLPGGVSASDFSAVPSFGFLQEARSLFTTVPALPVHALPIPTNDAQLRELSSPLQATSPQIPASTAELSPLSSPQIPGVAQTSRIDSLIPLGFQSVINPLEPLDVAPTLAPVSKELNASTRQTLSSEPFDVSAVRRDFPILQEKINGRPLIWLDNAATTQKPQSVIDRLSYFYAHENSNIHRAAHTLAARATDAYEAAREKVRRFLRAPSVQDIIFVRGATEGINLIAQSWGKRNVQKDDEIVITWLEHHANIVPWQMLCAEKGARLRIAPVDNTGQIILEEYEKLLGPRTRLVSIAHVSNALGTVTPVGQMIEAAHRHGAKVVVDGAQAVSHMSVDVQLLDCDFYVFSGHKIFAPTGIGVVYGKSSVLELTPPWQGGGNMISDVTFEKTQYQPPPNRFEAGTGSIGDAVGLGAAIDYLDRIGMPNISRYEHDLLVYATDALKQIPGLRLIGTAAEKASVLSFVLDGYRTEDVGTYLNQHGIAVRSGHHCAQPVLRRFGVESTVRPSLAFYNTCEEVDALIAALWNLKSGRTAGLV